MSKNEQPEELAQRIKSASDLLIIARNKLLEATEHEHMARHASTAALNHFNQQAKEYETLLAEFNAAVRKGVRS